VDSSRECRFIACEPRIRSSRPGSKVRRSYAPAPEVGTLMADLRQNCCRPGRHSRGVRRHYHRIMVRSPGIKYGHELIAAGLLLVAGPVDRDPLKRWVRTGYETQQSNWLGFGSSCRVDPFSRPPPDSCESWAAGRPVKGEIPKGREGAMPMGPAERPYDLGIGGGTAPTLHGFALSQDQSAAYWLVSCHAVRTRASGGPGGRCRG
jgi:hypothetical protein